MPKGCVQPKVKPRQIGNQEIGAFGEQLACRYLESRGYTVLARNWRPTGHHVRGELDVLAEYASDLVCIEVKTRRDGKMGTPFDAITQSKQRTLRTLTGIYLAHATVKYQSVRIDAIAIELGRVVKNGIPTLAKVTHLKGVC